jgi:hypothetical protein
MHQKVFDDIYKFRNKVDHDDEVILTKETLIKLFDRTKNMIQACELKIADGRKSPQNTDISIKDRYSKELNIMEKLLEDAHKW